MKIADLTSGLELLIKRVDMKWIMIALAVLWGSAMPVRAAVVYVDGDAAGADNGTSWSDAFNGLQDALASAAGNDEIWIAEGTYTNAATYALANDAITILGGFTNGMVSAEERDSNLYPVILDGLGEQHRILELNGADVELDGVIITNAQTTASIGTAGLKIAGATNVVLRNVSVGGCWSHNQNTTIDGFAVCISGTGTGRVDVVDCRFVDNQTGLYNGANGIGLNVGSFSQLTVSGCLFENNIKGPSYNAVYGGGLYLSDIGQAVVSNSVFSGNGGDPYQGRGCGGGLYVGANASAVVSDCVFDANYLVKGNGGYGGGAIAMESSSSVVSVERCVFENNEITSAGYGGAIYIEAGVADFVNCLMASNSADYGGAAYLASGSALHNCTVADNNAGLSGGGVYCKGAAITNSIVYGNTLTNATPDNVYDNGGSYAYTCSSPLLSGAGNIDSDPLLSDYLLSSNSPCLNRGLNEDWMNGAVDLAGSNRISALTVDMGAYEYDLVLDLRITNPVNGLVVAAPASIAVSGTGTNLAGDLAWTNALTGESGTTTAGTSWFIPSVSILAGENLISVSGTNAENVPIYDTVSVTGLFAGDLSITAGDVTTTNLNRFTIQGSSSNLLGNIVWSNALTGTSGTIPASTDWQFVCDLAEGANVLTVSGTNSSGTIADMVTVTSVITPVIHVDADAAGGNGTSWADAFVDLRDALAIATTQQIWVAEGLYVPDQARGGRVTVTDNDPNEVFTLPDGVTLYGGFQGLASETNRFQRNPRVYATVLSGDIDGNDINNDANNMAETPDDVVETNAYTVVTLADGGSATLEGFVITAGNAPNAFAGASGAGGGFYSKNAGTISMGDCRFLGNAAHDGGGAIYANNTSLFLYSCSIQGNRSDSSGGGLSVDNGQAQLVSTLVSGNAAATGSGIRCLYSDVLLANCTIVGNASASQGGGLRADRSSIYMYNSIVWNNSDSSGSNSASSTIFFGGVADAGWEDCLVANSGGSTNWNTALGDDGGDNLDADPQFKNGLDPSLAPTARGDYSLQLTSPAINQGNDLFALDDYDLAGNDRIYEDPLLQFDYIDMGAYETIDDGADTDGDHLTDYTEVVDYGSNPDLADTDGDGSTDGDEAFIGSDLLSADSVFKSTIQNMGSGNVQISWPQFNSGLRYTLVGCTNLVEGNWFYVDSTTSSNLTDTIDSDSVFYRINVTENN